jgi:hypothetical protein
MRPWFRIADKLEIFSTPSGSVWLTAFTKNKRSRDHAFKMRDALGLEATKPKN